MATVHSLPGELILQILTMAYCEYRPSLFDNDIKPLDPYVWANKHSLTLAARVHSSWRAPAQNLLALDLPFTDAYRRENNLYDLYEADNCGLRCRRFEIDMSKSEVSCSESCSEAAYVLGDVAKGWVRDLTLKVRDTIAREDVFTLEGLSNLRRLAVYAMPGVRTWPKKLDHLELDCQHVMDGPVPPEPLKASAKTLRSLSLILAEPAHLVGLPANLRPLTSLETLDITYRFVHNHPDHLPEKFEAALSATPSISRLGLHQFAPARVADALAGLRRDQHLAELWTRLVLPVHEYGELEDPNSPDEWLAGLERCVAHPALARVAKWRVAVLSPLDMCFRPVAEKDVRRFLFRALSRAEGKARWEAIKAAVRARGVAFEFVLERESQDPFGMRHSDGEDDYGFRGRLGEQSSSDAGSALADRRVALARERGRAEAARGQGEEEEEEGEGDGGDAEDADEDADEDENEDEDQDEREEAANVQRRRDERMASLRPRR